MRAASHLSVVRDGDLPPPFVPADIIIKDMPEGLMPQAMFDSDWWITASREARLYGFTLNLKSYKQKPAGSLPSDDRLLARLAECDHDEFLTVREQVLEGWVLCADGRFYRESIAIKVLAFWISRLFKRRSSAAGNAAQDRDVPDADAFNRPLFHAEEALAQLDPTHKEVRKCRAHRAKLAKQLRETAISLDAPLSPESSPAASPSGTPDWSPKGSEAKVKRSEDSLYESAHTYNVQPLSQKESGKQAGRDMGQTEPHANGPAPEPWPTAADGFPKFFARYPNPVDEEGAKIAYEAAREDNGIAFEAMLARVDAYARYKPPKQEWLKPSNWLKARRWRDRWAGELAEKPSTRPPAGAGPPRNPRAPEYGIVFVPRGSPQWRAWHAYGERARGRGFAGYPDAVSNGVRGWHFVSAWPPGAAPEAESSV